MRTYHNISYFVHGYLHYLLGLLIFDRVGWLYQYTINTVLDEERKPHYHHFRIKGKFSERSK